MFEKLKRYISLDGWKVNGLLNGSITFFHASRISFKVGEYNNDQKDPYRELGFRWISNFEDFGHFIDIGFWRYFFQIELDIRWFSRLTHWFSKNERSTGITITTSRFLVDFLWIDNDYASEYSWLKERSWSTATRGKWWFKLFWKVRRGFSYSFWWETLNGETEYRKKSIVGTSLEAAYKLSYAGETHEYKLPFTIEMETGEYNRTNILGVKKESRIGRRFSIEINLKQLADGSVFKIPVRLGKGENSWDLDDCPILSASTHTFFEELPKHDTRHAMLTKCSIHTESKEFQQAVRYMVEEYAIHVLNEWQKYGRSEDISSDQISW